MIFNMQLSEDASLAELSDIRVGVDGTVYPSAGDAVRGQITDVKEDFANFATIQNLVREYQTHVDGQAAGITFTWSDANTCNVSGTSTATAFSNFIQENIPYGKLKNDVAYYLDFVTTDPGIRIGIYFQKNGSNASSITNINVPTLFVIPSAASCDRMVVRLNISGGSTVNGTIKIGLYPQDQFKNVINGKLIEPYVSNGTLTLGNVVDDGIYVLDPTKYTISDFPDGAAGSPYASYLKVENLGSPKNNIRSRFIMQTLYCLSPARGYGGYYCRVSNPNGVWSVWLGGGLPLFQHLSSLPGCDADDLYTPDKTGAYLIDSTQTYTHLPITAGMLLVIKPTYSTTMQFAISWTGFKFYKRRKLDAGTWEDWQLLSGGNTYNITNNNTFEEYSQTVTLNASPQITSDTNNYLAPSGDTSDRTSDIMTMLNSNGICRLGAGTYYVKNLQMPEGSSILGSGYSTKVFMSTGDGFAIKMTSFCTVKDLQIVGDESNLTFTSTEGGRHGILWQGTYTADHNAPYRSIISGLYIRGFTGGGIRCYDTGYGTSNALEATNIYIWNCWAGLDVNYWSEFHKFTNVRCGQCRIGCVNNGGNNVFVNCDFSSNYEIAMLMNNSQGQSPNNTHGSCIGCVFNHTQHNGQSNSGIGVEILNCGSGFVFDGCQIFFSKIHLVDSDGITFNSCNFGYANCDIEIDGGGAILFMGNQHQQKAPISISNNQNVHFVNCYRRDTGAIIEP